VCGYHRSMIYMNVSHALAGVAVLADMLLTTHFMTLVLLTVWKLPLWVCALFYIAFAPIEATFWSSTLIKIPNGVARCAALFAVFRRLTAEAMAWLHCSTCTCCYEVICVQRLTRPSCARAGGWFTLCLAFVNASLMLLWFWGNSKKQAFFRRMTVPLGSFLKLGQASDNQLSMTIAQQKVQLSASGSSIKRARGAICHCKLS